MFHPRLPLLQDLAVIAIWRMVTTLNLVSETTVLIIEDGGSAITDRVPLDSRSFTNADISFTCLQVFRYCNPIFRTKEGLSCILQSGPLRVCSEALSRQTLPATSCQVPLLRSDYATKAVPPLRQPRRLS